MSFQGADPDALDELAGQCESSAQTVEGLRCRLARLLDGSWMAGPWALDFRTELSQSSLPAMLAVFGALNQMSTVAKANADAQRRASEGRAVDFSALPGYIGALGTPGGGAAMATLLGTVVGERLTTPDSAAAPSTGTATADGYERARESFFGPAPKDSTRATYATDAKTSTDQGIIAARMFIQRKDLGLFGLEGDNRGYSTDPNAPYRVMVAWDTRTGEVTYTAAPSTTEMTPVPYGLSPNVRGTPIHTVYPALPIGRGQPNELTVTDTGTDRLGFTYRATNSAAPHLSSSADGHVDIVFRPDNIEVRVRGDNFPSVEVIQYRLGQPPRNLLGAKEGVPFETIDAFPDRDVRQQTKPNERRTP
jgi:hypothetical protein